MDHPCFEPKFCRTRHWWGDTQFRCALVADPLALLQPWLHLFSPFLRLLRILGYRITLLSICTVHKQYATDRGVFSLCNDLWKHYRVFSDRFPTHLGRSRRWCLATAADSNTRWRRQQQVQVRGEAEAAGSGGPAAVCRGRTRTCDCGGVNEDRE